MRDTVYFTLPAFCFNEENFICFSAVYDMAGDDDDSWKSMFNASGAFESVDTQIAGLGQIPAIQELYVAHTGAVINQ